MKTIVIFALALVSLVSCGNKDRRIVEPKGGNAHMVLMEPVYDFGQVSDNNGIVEHEFVIANDGGKSFVLLSAKPHCDCTTVDFKSVTVEPGYGTTIKVKLNAKELSKGDFVREVDIIPSCQRDNSNSTIILRGEKI